MIMPTLMPSHWQHLGDNIVLSICATQAAPLTAQWHYQYIPQQPTTGYIERIRQNPRRRAAMNRAAQHIAEQLAAQGNTIVSLRLSQGYTQSELAKATGLQQSYLSRIENRRQTISDNNIRKIADVLHVQPADIREAFNRHWTQQESLA
nr:MAG TPA: helix-turn-helix domain protein [Bacteriophage sp.]